MTLTRRDFLIKGTALLATIGIGGPMLLADKRNTVFANADEGLPEIEAPVLVVIQLSGGNDGINTLIPYGLGGYYDVQPSL